MESVPLDAAEAPAFMNKSIANNRATFVITAFIA